MVFKAWAGAFQNGLDEFFIQVWLFHLSTLSLVSHLQPGLEDQHAVHLQAQRSLTTSGPQELHIPSSSAFSGDKGKHHTGVLHGLEKELCAMCATCFYIFPVKAEQFSVQRKGTEIRIRLEWCRPFPKTPLNTSLSSVPCYSLLICHFIFQVIISLRFDQLLHPPPATFYMKERSYKCILNKTLLFPHKNNTSIRALFLLLWLWNIHAVVC